MAGPTIWQHRAIESLPGQQPCIVRSCGLARPAASVCAGLAREDEAAEREESWGGAKSLWGLANTVEQLRTISRLQQEFCEWFYGHWLAEYAKAAKEVIGPVPVFVCSAAISGDADQYLAMHRWALREGVDGLIRNHYGHGGEEERQTLASLARWMRNVQRESGCTKHLWANEVGYVPPRTTDDDAAAELAGWGLFWKPMGLSITRVAARNAGVADATRLPRFQPVLDESIRTASRPRGRMDG